MTDVTIGFFLFSLVYAAIRYVLTWDKSYLFYGSYVLLTSIYLTYEYKFLGLGPTLQTTLSAKRMHSFAQEPLLLISYVFYYYFLLNFFSLDIRPFTSRLLKSSAHIVLGFFIVAVVLLFVSIPALVVFEAIAIVSVVMISIFTLYHLWQLGTYLSRIVISGTVLYLLGSTIGYIDANSSIFPYPGTFAYGTYCATAFGFVFELLFFTAGLGYRDKMIQKKNESLSRISEMYAMKSQFYDGISHEFRTPLTLIKGLTNELEGLQNFKDKINRHCDDILRLVDNMLELSKMDSNMVDSKESNLELISFLKMIMDGYSVLASSKGMSITLDSTFEELTVEMDEEKLKTVLSNLIVNAIKYGGDYGDLISLSVQTDDDYVILRVMDNGPGIDPEDIPHIFDRHYRGSKITANGSGGTGLGLSIVHNYVSMMKGKIDVTNGEPRGCQFTIHLPLKGANISAPNHETKNIHYTQAIKDDDLHISANSITDTLPTQSVRILLVDDNKDLADYIRGLLRRHHHEVLWAQDGLEGVAMCKAAIPDIIISDVMMPRMDGYEFCRTIKSDPITDHIPIIMLTAKASKDYKIQGLGYGADAYLFKPFENQELLAHIDQIIRQQERLRNHYAQLVRSEAGSQFEENTPQKKHPFLESVETQIDQHLGESTFGVEQLSAALHIDRTQLYRKLKALSGYTPSQLIKERRLASAVQRLRHNHHSIAEIAEICGYNSQSYFSKVFLEVYNCTPTEYRANPRHG